MAKYKQAEFAKLCWVTSAYISVNKKRGKVIFGADGLIDDSIRENADFLKREQEKNFGKTRQTTPPKEVKGKKKSEDGDVAEGKKRTKYDLDLEKKEHDIEKIKVDIRLQQLREEKIRGEVIPTVLVQAIFYSYSQSTITSNKDFTELMLIKIQKECRLTGEQLARLRGEMLRGLNAAADKTIALTKSNIESVLQEFSIKKEVGEHD